MSHRALASPSSIPTRDLLIKKQTQLSSYLHDKVSFLRKCAISRRSPLAPNVLKLLSQQIHTKKSSTIITSLSADGCTFASTPEILSHSSAFYRSVYSHQSDGSPSHPIWTVPSSSLSLSTHLLLSQPFSSAETSKALASLPSNSTPGLDGLPKEFFSYYWHCIGPLFSIMLHEFVTGVVPPSLLRVATVLIFKKGDKSQIENYRPISLLGTDYKIIAKLLSTRLSTALPSIIHPDQTGFVRGRSIHDTLSYILDTADHCHSFFKPAFLFLLDIRKAYDTLDRSFLFRTLLHLGLPSPFIKLVEQLHNNASMQLYINSCLAPPIPLLSGVRQGCPLAPQLFICAIEMFHRFASRSLSPLCLSPSHPRLLSCYADDITIFFKDLSEVPRILQCISSFAEVSNEHPNLSKCAILPLGISRNAPIPLHLPVPYIPAHSAERILGIHLSPSDSSEFTWQHIIPTLERKLRIWSSTYPTIRSRILIVNHFIVPKFLFQARFHPPPPSIWCSILFLLYNFLSNNKINSSRTLPRLWSQLLLNLPVQQGGLGLINPCLRLQALSLQRIAHLFRFNHPCATYCRGLLPLPFHTLSFLAHPRILSSPFPFSTRWRATLQHLFSSSIRFLPPPLHPLVLHSTALYFARKRSLLVTDLRNAFSSIDVFGFVTLSLKLNLSLGASSLTRSSFQLTDLIMHPSFLRLSVVFPRLGGTAFVSLFLTRTSSLASPSFRSPLLCLPLLISKYYLFHLPPLSFASP